MHNVGFKEISVQFYSELYNKRISSYSYSWDHMGLKSLPKLSKSEQMKTPCFFIKKMDRISSKTYIVYSQRLACLVLSEGGRRRRRFLAVFS